MSLIIYILLIIYAMASGKKDAVLWSGKMYNSYPWDEHLIFTVERFAVWIAAGCSIVFAFNHWINIYGGILALVAAAASFPFFHNGMYYKSRKDIDGAYDSWLEYSTDYKSFWNFKPWIRTVLFIAFTLYLICYEYYF